MVVQKFSIQTCYYVTTFNSMSLYIYIYIYIYRHTHTHTNTHICNLAVTNTIFNYQNIQGLFLFSNLYPHTTLMYHLYIFPTYYIYIYIYVLFLSLLKPISLVFVMEKFQLSIHVFFFLYLLHIKGTSLSLSFRFLYNLDVLFVLMLYDRHFTSSKSSWIN